MPSHSGVSYVGVIPIVRTQPFQKTYHLEENQSSQQDTTYHSSSYKAIPKQNIHRLWLRERLVINNKHLSPVQVIHEAKIDLFSWKAIATLEKAKQMVLSTAIDFLK